MKKITQTQKKRHDHWLLGGNPNAIYLQEAEGQAELCQGAQLPRKSNDYLEKDAAVAYKKMGIRVYPFAEKVARVFKDQAKKIDSDPMFVGVILPAAWKIEATAHSMWTNLMDGKGGKRASIFYKAAFYDRSAHINFIRRYSYQHNYANKEDFDDRRSQYVITDNATGVEIFATDITTVNDYRPGQQAAEAWLNEHFPNWKDLTAYWD